jgi:tetratricopeptide (TPR) repeat protein
MMQKQLQFAEALPMLEQCLELASGVSGAGVDKFLPLTLGFIGECYFQLNQMDKAKEYVERALQTTTLQGDHDASMAYLANLYEISRYSGKYDLSIKYAQDAADRSYDRGELVTASNWRHHARAVEKGEPLYRIVLKIGDEYFELDEIPKVHGERVEFIFVRNRIELVLCSQKCYEGRELTAQGDYDQAIKVFEEAKLFDPYSPQPYYMAGNIKLAGRRYAEAVEDLKKCEELCPGFESARADLWLAEQLAAGKMEHDSCKVAYETNNEEIPLLERVAFCYELADKYPNFGECYWRLGKMLIEKEEAEVAVEVFKRGIELSEEQDVLSRLYRDLAILTQDEQLKREYFSKSASFEKGNTLGQAMSLYMLRQMDPE